MIKKEMGYIVININGTTNERLLLKVDLKVIRF